jgi:hypothetical protein
MNTSYIRLTKFNNKNYIIILLSFLTIEVRAGNIMLARIHTRKLVKDENLRLFDVTNRNVAHQLRKYFTYDKYC